MIARVQLLELGLHPQGIKHRVSNGRLHRVRAGRAVWRGVYAVGTPQLTRRGRWMAAVLCCGPGAVLSHESAADLWGIRRAGSTMVHVSVPRNGARSRPGIRVHQRSALPPNDMTRRARIPLTSPARTLIDLASHLPSDELERAVNEADNHDLIDPEALRAVVGERPGATGVRALRNLLDARTFTLTRSELERRFLPLADRAGLPRPKTAVYVNGFEVDFYWPELGLVVECDGLTYHRTPAQQARDRIRDQAHTAAGLTPLRFTHEQVRYEPEYVERILRRVAVRLGAAA